MVGSSLKYYAAAADARVMAVDRVKFFQKAIVEGEAPSDIGCLQQLVLR